MLYTMKSSTLTQSQVNVNDESNDKELDDLKDQYIKIINNMDTLVEQLKSYEDDRNKILKILYNKYNIEDEVLDLDFDDPECNGSNSIGTNLDEKNKILDSEVDPDAIIPEPKKKSTKSTKKSVKSVAADTVVVTTETVEKKKPRKTATKKASKTEVSADTLDVTEPNVVTETTDTTKVVEKKKQKKTAVKKVAESKENDNNEIESIIVQEDVKETVKKPRAKTSAVKSKKIDK